MMKLATTCYRELRVGVLLSVLSLSVAATAATETTQDTSTDEQTGEQSSEEPEPLRFEERIHVEGTVDAVPALESTFVKIPISLQSTPASVSVVPRFVIESQDANVLGDALRNASGVNVGTGFGVFDFFVIRGFDSLDTGLVMTDGAFEPESTFYQLYNVERVEVLKGPVAFLYGGNPLSGSVNLVRKNPRASNLADLRLRLGSFGTFQGTADFNLAREDGRAALRVNTIYSSSDFYRDDKENDLFAVNPVAAFQLNERTPLTVNFEYVSNDYRPDSGLPLFGNELPDVPRTRSYQSPLDFSDQAIYRLRVDLSSEISPRWTLRNKLYFTDLDWETDGTLLVGAFPNAMGNVDVFRNLTLLDDRQKMLGNQFEALTRFSTGSIEHQALFGIELSRWTDEFALDVAFLPSIDLFDPVETTTEPLFFVPGQASSGDVRNITFAPYFVDELTFSEALQIFLGGRLDALDYEDRVTGTMRDPTSFSPMVGGVYHLQPDLALYANYGEAFAPPSSLIVGEREPEESWQFEVGTKKTFDGDRSSVTVAFYNLERDKIGIPDANGITQQAGNQRSRGIEIELGTEWEGAGVPWFSFVSYAFNDSVLTEFRETVFTGAVPPFLVFDRSGNSAPFAPRHLFNLWTMGELANGLGLGGGARYVSGQFIAADNVYEIGGYFTLDATVSYRVSSWKLSLNLKNLTDTDFETRGFGNSAVIPADPLAVYASIQFLVP
ncbi:MAG: TonB-dependent receptor [Vicinamibacteria bacterium]